MNKNENKKLSLVGDLLACRVEGCKDKALTLSDYCWLHIPDKEAYKSRVLETLNKESSARRFNLKKVVLEGIELMNIDFSEADLSQGILSESNLFYNNFSKADLMGCDLSKSDLTGSVFLEADLTRCNLAGTRFWHSDFSNASLTEANLSNADLWQCKLYNSRMWRADISNAKFLTRLSFSQRKGKFITVEKINEKTYLSAEDAYRCLKRYFITQGRYDDASWASFKEKNMEKM